MIRERIAMLCDELLRRGVPKHLVDPIVAWLDGHNSGPVTLPLYGGLVWTSHVYTVGPDGVLRCTSCGSKWDMIDAMQSCPGPDVERCACGAVH